MKTAYLTPLTLLAATLSGWSAASVATEQAAPAMSSADVPSIVIDYSDLNLASRSGTVALYARLSRAAKRVCEPVNGRSLQEREAYRQCQQSSLARAVRAVGHPAVLALHAARGPRGTRG